MRETYLPFAGTKKHKTVSYIYIFPKIVELFSERLENFGELIKNEPVSSMRIPMDSVFFSVAFNLL